MSGILASLPFIGKLLDDTADIIKQAVPDSDLQTKIIGNLEEIKRNADLEFDKLALQTQTVPWVDGLHKMGRQILNYAAIVYCLVCLWVGHDISQAEVLLIGGPNIAYQIIKGKGLQPPTKE